LTWFWLRACCGDKIKTSASFIAGALIPFTPVFWLLAKAPRVVFFNIVQYQAMYRRADWATATEHDVDVLSSWLSDGQTLLLGMLSLFGVYFLFKKSGWTVTERRPFYLATWIALALSVYIATAHPTFARYFIVAIPLVATLAAVGLYAAGSRLAEDGRPFWPTAILIFLIVLGYGRGVFDERDSTTWGDYQKIANKVAEVTPHNGVVFADELVYFLLRRTPPSGLEFSYSHKVDLPAAEQKLYHIISEKDLVAQVKAGRFDTFESCNDDKVDEMHLDQVYAKKQDIKDCFVYWQKKSSGRPAK
jgi:hypothetical protein